jgi:hypothetical protein
MTVLNSTKRKTQNTYWLVFFWDGKRFKITSPFGGVIVKERSKFKNLSSKWLINIFRVTLKLIDSGDLKKNNDNKVTIEVTKEQYFEIYNL